MSKLNVRDRGRIAIEVASKCKLGDGRLNVVAAAELYNKESGEELNAGSFRSLYRRATCRAGGVVHSKPEMSESDRFHEELLSEYSKRIERRASLELSDFFDIAESVKGLKDDLDISSLVAAADAGSDDPIGLVPMCDLHLGSPACAYGALRKDIGLIQSDSRLRVLRGGDWGDYFNNTFPSAIAVAGQTVSPMIQKLWAEKIMTELKDKIVAAVGGNHDLMDERKTGISSEYFILRNMPFPYLKYGGLIKLKVGSQYYEILWKHNYRGNSYINEFNAHRRLRMLWGNADICVLEHIHSPATAITESGGLTANGSKTIVNIRAGAYKQADEYSTDQFRPGIISPTTVVLFPNERKIVPFHGADAISDAITFLDGLGVKKK